MSIRGSAFFFLVLAVALALPACGVGPKVANPKSSGRDVTETLVHGGRERTYHLHLPPSFDDAPADRRFPLILALHGGGGSGARFEKQTTDNGLEPEAEKRGYVIAYPEGIDRGWNDGRTEAAVRNRAGVDDVGFLSALIDHLVKHNRVNPKRVYATGISNGGIMSFRLACELSEKIAAIAPVTASMPLHLKGSAPQQPVSVLVINGTDDPLVPYAGGDIRITFFGFGRSRGKVLPTDETVAHWVKVNGCKKKGQSQPLPDLDPNDGTHIEQMIYGEGKHQTEVQLLRVEGGGHTWPGGKQYLPTRRVGRVSRDLKASKSILDFFDRHAKP